MKIYNSLSRKKEIFEPNNSRQVSMYICGVTVYDHSHLGHALSSIVFDVLYRYLKYKGYSVKKVQNFTDIDDKIINKASQEKTSSEIISDKYIKSFFNSIDGLNVLRADAHPRATEDMDEIIRFIQDLIHKGYAYESSGSVYFNVKKFEEYGKLSGNIHNDEYQSTRIDKNLNKKHNNDFALWKISSSGEPFWDSPWSKGRPGWHIECSAMVKKHLGDQIDIHGGGMDLIFPHHENEIAQSESFSSKKPFVKYWMHNGMLRVKGAEMSKSLGNTFSINEALKRFSSDAIRLWILQSHYRTNPLLDLDLIESTEKSLTRLRLINSDVKSKTELKKMNFHAFKQRFIESMDDDLNTPKAIATIFDLAKMINKSLSTHDVSEGLILFKELSNILGLNYQKLIEDRDININEIEKMIEERNHARLNKNWKDADLIRDKLLELGIEITDTSEGTKWKN
ncbi:MAG: cysteine--tRNA ligase [Chloroflexi bacterium]|nr:cysteine--tRNA ligase [Chloroflexota bacterium]